MTLLYEQEIITLVYFIFFIAQVDGRIQGFKLITKTLLSRNFVCFEFHFFLTLHLIKLTLLQAFIIASTATEEQMRNW